jgi:hypothetical protein
VDDALGDAVGVGLADALTDASERTIPALSSDDADAEAAVAPSARAKYDTASGSADRQSDKNTRARTARACTVCAHLSVGSRACVRSA